MFDLISNFLFDFKETNFKNNYLLTFKIVNAQK